jgi:hypothetical protein
MVVQCGTLNLYQAMIRENFNMAAKRLRKLSSISLGGAGVAIVLAAGLVYSANHRAFKLPAIDTAAVVTPSGSVLDFSAIGVQIPLNSSVSDAVYAPFPITKNDGSHAYGVSSVSLIKANSSLTSGCSAANGPLGLVIATTSQPVAPDGMSTTPVSVDNKTLFKIGSTYYRYVPPMDMACTGGGITVSAVEATQQAFETSFTSIKADSTASTAPVSTAQ